MSLVKKLILPCRHRLLAVRRTISFSVRCCVEEKSIDGSKYENIPLENIRNFSIIAHVDHGKSTLADRLLEITGALKANSENKQVLDKLQVERERGITVKAQTASLLYDYKGARYLLNLIDTPGHVDFSNEVSRSLAACQGVVLLVDANQGVQAQTVANYYLAMGRQLTLVPVLNKIDLKNADVPGVTRQLQNLFKIEPDSVLKKVDLLGLTLDRRWDGADHIEEVARKLNRMIYLATKLAPVLKRNVMKQVSAKQGTGVHQVLEAIIERVPHPYVDRTKSFQALLYDSWYDRYRGVTCLVYVTQGAVHPGDQIRWLRTDKTYTVKTLSLLCPHEVPASIVEGGMVCCLTCNMRERREAQVGDTLGAPGVSSLPGLPPPQPAVYAGLYPFDQSHHEPLRAALERLTLNDPSVSMVIDSSPALGQGWRLGFLGLLHLEVFGQRLEQEYGAQAILTSPSVTYKVKIEGKKNIEKYGREEVYISNPGYFPDPNIITEMYEPFVTATIITPDEFLGEVLSLCMERRGTQESAVNIDNTRVMLRFNFPLSEIIVDFHDRLKSLTAGFASFDYENKGFVPSNLVKLVILLNGIEVDELSSIVHTSRAVNIGKRMCEKLLEIIPRQQFQVAIQAKVGGTVVARQNLKPYRKDVTAKLYGGDVTRRKKLLKRQADGKKKLKMVANIALPRETFIDVLKR